MFSWTNCTGWFSNTAILHKQYDHTNNNTHDSTPNQMIFLKCQCSARTQLLAESSDLGVLLWPNSLHRRNPLP